MNVWLCPVKPSSWRIIKRKKLFGLPKRGLKIFGQVRLGDILVFYVLKPVNGIVALGKVKSEVFESHRDVWGKERYPFRVKIEFIPQFILSENESIPIGSFLGRIDNEKGITIEPYLKDVWITRISYKQYQTLKELFKASGNESNCG